jgi:hypothetical protein
MHRTRITGSLPGLLALTVAGVLSMQFACARDLFVYPKGGQSPEQQKQDESECHSWAVSKSGFDPNNPPTPPATPSYGAPPPKKGGFLNIGEGGMFQGSGAAGDAATGAALGAIGGAIAGGPGMGAAIGAASSTLFGAIKRSERQSEEEAWRQRQEAETQRAREAYRQEVQEQASDYKRAFSACMTSRNYTVE